MRSPTTPATHGHLELFRRIGQSIVIQTDAGPVTIQVSEINRHGGSPIVKLAFDADCRVRILRSELLRRAPP